MSTCNRMDLQTRGSQPVVPKNLPGHWIGKNRQLVTNEPVEVASRLCRRITYHFSGIYRIYPNLIKENQRMWTSCNRLDLQTLGSHPVMVPKNLPKHGCSPHMYVREESAVDCRWTGWVREMTGWSWIFGGNLPIVLEESVEFTPNEWKWNRKMSTCNWSDLESVARILTDSICPKTNFPGTDWKSNGLPRGHKHDQSLDCGESSVIYLWPWSWPRGSGLDHIFHSVGSCPSHASFTA